MCSFAHTTFFHELLQENRQFFQEHVAKVPCDGVWGPDFFLYESDTEFVDLASGVVMERNVSKRITDISRYPETWKQFVDWKGKWGYNCILPNTIIEENEGGSMNPIEIDEDEDECCAELKAEWLRQMRHMQSEARLHFFNQFYIYYFP